MKSTVSLLLLSLLFVTCNKDNVFDKYGSYGEGSAEVNDRAWSGTCRTTSSSLCYCDALESCISVEISQYAKDGLLLSVINFSRITPEKGIRPLNYIYPSWERTCDQMSCAERDDDVLLGMYSVHEQSDSNYLEITDLNLETGNIKGTFQATLIRDSSWVKPGQTADTLRIRNGSFYGKIYREN